MKYRLLCLFLALLMLALAGCAPQTPGASNPSNPPSDSSAPSDSGAPSGSGTPAESASMAAEGANQPLDRSALSLSSGGLMTETENGYYLCTGYRLYYADKSDLTNWVTVCNDPSCHHNWETCPAYVGDRGFFLDHDKIYSLRVVDPLLGNRALFTTDLSGTGLQPAVPIPQFTALGQDAAFWWHCWQDKMMGYVSILQNNGNYRNVIYQATASGVTELCSMESTDKISGQLHSLQENYGILGTEYFTTSILNEENPNLFLVYRVEDGKLVQIPGMENYLSDRYYGSYLQGDMLYTWVQKDGYYRINVKDGATVRRGDMQLPNGYSYQLSPGYILEWDDHTPGTPEMRLYNGTEWKSVSLPDGFDFRKGMFRPLGISETHLFLMIDLFGNGIELYQISLKEAAYTVQHCGDFEGFPSFD